MKKCIKNFGKHFLLFSMVAGTIVSCKKQNISNKPGTDLSHVTLQQLNLTPAQAVEIYIDDADLKINCGSYQLAEALKSSLNSAIADHIYAIVTSSTLDDKTVYYDDLFTEFPELQTTINNYLSTHSYGQPYEYESYAAIKADFVRDGMNYEPSIYMPTVVAQALPVDYVPSASNIVIGIPVEVDLEDVDNQDRVFAWDITSGQATTVGIGEADATTVASGTTSASKWVLVSGLGRKTTTYDPPVGGGNNPVPYQPNVDPWGSGGGAAYINRVKISQRFEGNKYSEVKLSYAYGDWLGTKAMWDWNGKEHLKDVHKDDLNTDKWIAPVKLTNFIGWNEAKRSVYNVYEYDWYGNKHFLGGKWNSSGWTETIKGDRKYASEYYLFDPWHNSSQSSHNFAHPECYTLYYNNSVNVYGSNGECGFTK